MKRLLISIVFLLTITLDVWSVGPLYNAVRKNPCAPRTRENYHISREPGEGASIKKTLHEVVFTDIQCSIAESTDEYFAKERYAIHDCPLSIVNIEISGLCDNYVVNKLCLANDNGDILDELYGEIQAYPGIVIKQFVIENDTIKTYSLKPQNTEPIMFEGFGHSIKSFVGYRLDQEYTIEQGHFKLCKNIRYKPETYTYERLFPNMEPFNFFIWKGEETIESIQTVN